MKTAHRSTLRDCFWAKKANVDASERKEEFLTIPTCGPAQNPRALTLRRAEKLENELAATVLGRDCTVCTPRHSATGKIAHVCDTVPCCYTSKRAGDYVFLTFDGVCVEGTVRAYIGRAPCYCKIYVPPNLRTYAQHVCFCRMEVPSPKDRTELYEAARTDAALTDALYFLQVNLHEIVLASVHALEQRHGRGFVAWRLHARNVVLFYGPTAFDPRVQTHLTDVREYAATGRVMVAPANIYKACPIGYADDGTEVPLTEGADGLSQADCDSVAERMLRSYERSSNYILRKTMK